MSSATYVELLKENRNFRRLWIGQVISELGTWFSFIAELGLVRMFSGSPLATTALMVSRLLPFFIVAPIAGVVVDRYSRKQIMIAADLLRAVVALGYLVAATTGSVWAVCACSATMSSLAVFFEAAKNASMPNMVTPRELLTANIMMYSTRFLQFTLGSALGGITAARFGYEAAFVVDSMSFVASAVSVALISAAATRQQSIGGDDTENGEIPGPSTVPARPRFFADLRAGLAYIWANSFVRAIILVNIGWAMGAGMNNVLYDQIGGHLFVSSKDDRGDWGVATLFTAAGIGLFIGMLLARRIGGLISKESHAASFVGWSLVAHGLFFASAGLMPSLTLIALCVGISRLMLAAEFGVQETFVMRVTPDGYRGRVFTTDRSLELGMMTISMIAGGSLLKWVSPLTMMMVSGLLSATPGVVWLLAVRFSQFRVPARAVRQSYDSEEVLTA